MINAMTIQNVMNPITQGAAGQGQGNAMGSDAFAALLAQLMGGDTAAGEGSMDMLLQQLAGMNTQKEGEKQGSLMAADLFANLMGTQQMPLWNLAEGGELAGNLPQNIAASLSRMAAGGQALSPELLTAVTQVAEMVAPQETQGQTRSQNGSENPFAQILGEEKVGAEEPDPLTALISQAGKGEAEDSLSGQARFSSSVWEAQKLLEGTEKGKGKSEAKVDIEALQAQVDAQNRTPATELQKLTRSSEPPVLDRKDFAEQMKEGITQNLHKGTGEFTIKLKPEGLGEITVKMVEEGEKISLSIFTATAQTAKLLDGEIHALREAVRPYQVEVREVVTVQQSQQSAYANHGDQFSQSFAGQQNQQFYRSNQGSWAGPMGEGLPEEPGDTATLQASAVDTYI